MKLYKPSALSAAVLAATTISGSSQAEFLNDSHLDIQLRNVYFNHTVSEKNTDGSTQNWHQWAQGAEINFQSGYLSDVIGFDASYYGALKLDRGGANKPLQLIGGSQGDSSHYHRLGQAYLKAKAGNDELSVYGQAGYMSGNKGLILGSRSRATPSAYRGAQGEISACDFTFYGTYVDRIGLRTQSSWDKFTTKAGDEIDHAWQLGSTYSANNITAELTYLEAKDYQQQYLIDLGYHIDWRDNMSWLLSANYHQANSHGKLWGKSYLDNGNPKIAGNFDNTANHINLNAQLSVGPMAVQLSFARTVASKHGELGLLDYKFADNEYGRVPSQVSRYISDFMYNGERVWQIQAGYDFADLALPGLDITLAHTRGININDQSSQKLTSETENNVIVKYAFQEQSLQGLSIKFIQAWHTAKYDAKANVDTRHLRAYVDYTVSVF